MGGSPPQDVFDVRKIAQLIELMKEHDLNEIDLRQGDMRIQLRRGGHADASLPAAPPPVAMEAPKPEVASAQKSADEEHVELIRSPMVGTFYTAADPDSPPFAKAGDIVSAETTVCIVEAMKVFNEIQAEVSGKILAVLIENGEPVEFGQPLFKVDVRK